MTDHRDIEEALREFEHDPAAGVKDAVMAAYGEAYRAPARTELWKRPVPLYAAAAVVIFLAGMSFVAGRHVAPADRAGVAPTAEPADGSVTSQVIEWRPATSDVL